MSLSPLSPSAPLAVWGVCMCNPGASKSSLSTCLVSSPLRGSGALSPPLAVLFLYYTNPTACGAVGVARAHAARNDHHNHMLLRDFS